MELLPRQTARVIVKTKTARRLKYLFLSTTEMPISCLVDSYFITMVNFTQLSVMFIREAILDS